MQASAMVPLSTITGVLVLFTIKHFAADFLFQTRWMAHGKERRDDWVRPLLSHVGCHAGLTLLIALALSPRLWWLALVDLVVHFGIDHAKSLTQRWGQWSTDNPRFWWLLGFDQLLHHMTNIAFAAAIVAL